MWSAPSKAMLARVPGFYETEGKRLEDKVVHEHFFIFGCDWYVVEYDGDDRFFGYAILNEDYIMAEWGYFSRSELWGMVTENGFEIDGDRHWKKRRAVEVRKIRMGNGWARPAKEAA